jgi:hypothetical protein
MSTLEVNTINPQSGTTITIGGSGDTVSLGSGATQSGFGGTNTPAFHVRAGSNQTGISNATFTTVQFDTEDFDTDNCFNTSTYTFTASEAGKYYFYSTVWISNSVGVSNIDYGQLRFLKNGSQIGENGIDFRNSDVYGVTVTAVATLDMSVSDTLLVQLRGQVNSGNITTETSQKRTYFGGYKLIGA